MAQAGTENNRAYDFDKLRKRRRRFAALKRLMGLSGLVLLVAGLVALNGYLVDIGFSTRLNDLRESFGGAGFPAAVPAGQNHRISHMAGNLLVLNDTGLYIYNPNAKLVRTVQRLSDESVAVASRNRLLTYTPGSRSVAVHSISQELFSRELEFGVICGDINDNGDFAVVAPAKQFASKVSVYDGRYEEIYSWSSPEYVSKVALKDEGPGPGSDMALNVINGSEGVLESLIYLFDFDESREQAEVAHRIPGELTLDMFFTADGEVAVITDRQYLLLSNSGEKLQSYSFGSRQLLAFERRRDQTILLMREPDRQSRSIALLDKNLDEKATKSLALPATDIALGADSAYVLNSEGIDVYSLALEPKARLVRKGVQQFHMAENQLYYLTGEEIRALSNGEMIGI